MRLRLSRSRQLSLFCVLVVGLLLPMMFQSGVKSSDQMVRVPYDTVTFIKELVPAAQELGQAYGVKPSVLIAQAILENQSGSTLLSVKYSNLYHLTAQTNSNRIVLKTKQEVDGQEKEVKVVYQIYPNWSSGMRDYLARLKAGQLGDKELYQQLATAKGYWETAQVFVKHGYTTDKTYGEKLLKLITKYKLEQYDKN